MRIRAREIERKIVQKHSFSYMTEEKKKQTNEIPVDKTEPCKLFEYIVRIYFMRLFSSVFRSPLCQCTVYTIGVVKMSNFLLPLFIQWHDSKLRLLFHFTYECWTYNDNNNNNNKNFLLLVLHSMAFLLKNAAKHKFLKIFRL